MTKTTTGLPTFGKLLLASLGTFLSTLCSALNFRGEHNSVFNQYDYDRRFK